MGNKNNAIKDFGIYKTWVVSKELPAEKMHFLYFPDFPEMDAFKVEQGITSDKKGKIIHGKLHHFISNRIISGEGVNPAMSKKNLEDIYGETSGTLVSVNMWTMINKIYPPKNEKPKLLLPPLRDLLNPPKEPLNLDFWVGIYDACDDYQEDTTKKIEFKYIKPRYEVTFPEINEDAGFIIDALTDDELFEEIDKRLIQSVKEYITRCGAFPDKWSREAAQKKCIGADRFIEVSLDQDDYLEILSQTNPYRVQQAGMYQRNFRPL